MIRIGRFIVTWRDFWSGIVQGFFREYDLPPEHPARELGASECPYCAEGDEEE